MKTKFLVVSIALVDYILDVNIPKKTKSLINHNGRVLHISDIDTCMGDEDILHIMSKFGNSLLVTHDRNLALRAAKKYRTLFIKEPLNAEEIAACIAKKYNLLETISIFCYNNITCEKCYKS